MTGRQTFLYYLYYFVSFSIAFFKDSLYNSKKEAG